MTIADPWCHVHAQHELLPVWFQSLFKCYVWCAQDKQQTNLRLLHKSSVVYVTAMCDDSNHTYPDHVVRKAFSLAMANPLNYSELTHEDSSFLAQVATSKVMGEMACGGRNSTPLNTERREMAAIRALAGFGACDATLRDAKSLVLWAEGCEAHSPNNQLQ